MTVYTSKVERARFMEESTFGADLSASFASFQQIPFNEGTASWKILRPVESPLHAQQRVDGIALGVLMPKAAEFSFTCNLETATTKATSTVASSHTWLTRLLKLAFGSYHQGTGTTHAAGWNTVTGDGAIVTTLVPGSAVGAVYSTTGAFEAREIKSKSGSTLTLKLARSGAPATSAIMYGSTCVFPSPRVTGVTPGAQFIVEGWNVEDRWLLVGGALESLTLELEPGKIPRLTFKWKFASYMQANGTDTAQDLTGDVLGVPTYTDVNTLVVVDSEFRMQTVGTSTLASTLYHPSTITIEPQTKFVAVRSPAGVQNIYGWARVHEPPVIKGSFLLPYEDSQEWFAARDNRTAKSLTYQIGTGIAVGAVLVSVPNVQIVDVQREDIGGVQGQKVDWLGRLEADVTAESTFEAIAETAYRMHFF